MMIHDNAVFFRGKRKDTKEWVKGSLIFSYPEEGKPSIPYIGFVKGDDVVVDEVIPETVGQCAGFFDKNGILIFSGDIVSCSHEGRGLVPVKDRAPNERSFGTDEKTGLPLVARMLPLKNYEGIVTVDLSGRRIDLPAFCSWFYNFKDDKCMALEVVGNIYERNKANKKEE